MEITFNSSEPKPNVQKYYYCHITDEPKLNLHITALIPNKLYQESLLLFLKTTELNLTSKKLITAILLVNLNLTYILLLRY